MSEYVVLDVETKRLSTEVQGGWKNIPDFGLAVAVLMYDDDHHAIFTESNSDLLAAELQNAQRIVTFNGIRFDYEVLRPYGLDPEALYPKSFDILHEMQQVLGHRVSLNTVAQATLGTEKTADGKLAVQWYKAGKLKKVIKYCVQDVLVTKRIYEYARDNGFVYYFSRLGAKVPCHLTTDKTPFPPSKPNLRESMTRKSRPTYSHNL